MSIVVANIEALDLLFFNSGRSFSMGDDSWTDSIFPPYPSTIYGMLRTHYFENNMDDLSKANEDDDPTKNLKITFSGIELRTAQYCGLIFPCPKDFVKNNTNELTRLICEDIPEDFIHSSKAEHWLKSPIEGKVASIDKLDYITEVNLIKYLNGETISDYIELNKYITTEEKVGIKRNFLSRINEDGSFYQINQIRPSNIESQLKFTIGFEGLDFSNAAIARLGGEGKLVNMKTTNTTVKIDTPELKEDTDKIIMYLATPAIFDEGWQPKAIFEKYNIEVLTAANNDIHNIGGWDMQKKQPKPMVKAIGAGSVYYLKGSKSHLQNLIDGYHGKCIGIDEYTKQGFGLTYFGII